MTADPSIPEIQTELDELVLERFDHDDAWRLGVAIRDIAVAEGLGVAIRVTRGAQLAFQGTTTGSSADNDDWIAKKVRLVERLNMASLEGRLKRDAGSLHWLDTSVYAPAGGCVPLRVAGGALVGTVTVSGLKDVDDHALAIRGLKALLGR